jgi:outer membrane receptor for ferrienterochelin and colicin
MLALMINRICKLAILSFVIIQSAFAGTDGTLSGTVFDPQAVAISSASIKVLSADGKLVKETTSSLTGEFQVFPLTFGDYQLVVEAPGFASFQEQVHVSAGSSTQEDVHMAPKAAQEMVLEVKAKRHLVQNSSSQSSTSVTKEQIAAMPQGDQISLPKLLETTSPGVVEGPFNQVFIRGNHANIQYQIDGIQLPDSSSGTFAEAFSPRNIDHYELITGGIPSEFGERMAAVMNIVTKTGPEAPNGSVDMNYGSYNTISPQALFGGSNASGNFHYYLSGNYHQTDRGIDTPQPETTTNESSGGTEATHDYSNGNNEFAKMDWLLGNDDKVSLILFQSYNKYEIPNFDSSFNPHDTYFTADYSDQYGNTGFQYRLPDTNDVQYNRDAYAQLVWKHTFSEKSFLQVAPYWKYSGVRVDNDLANDLAPANPADAAVFNPGISATSFTLNQHVNNEGVKADYTYRPNNSNLIKAGLQVQATQSHDDYSVSSLSTTLAAPGLPVSSYFDGGDDDKGYEEAVYVQDDYQISKAWSLNIGLRMTGVQFNFGDSNASFDQLQPRVGLNYLATETTKLHAYYGRLFQPAPLENLREAFDQASGGTTANFYDIKPETDNYFEVGVDQQIAQTHVTSVNVYYKRASNMLDDTQLLNTSIATPYNFADGYAYGIEYSLHGKLSANWSDYLNYSYEIAKGENISGGSFAFNSANPVPPQNTYLFLDHVQEHTANGGFTYAKDQYYGTVQGLFGSGLRTGDQNQYSLPSHFSFDLSGGYNFNGENYWSKWKVSGDILNITNNAFPITIANGYNGSHYAAGREFFIRLSKEI